MLPNDSTVKNTSDVCPYFNQYAFQTKVDMKEFTSNYERSCQNYLTPPVNLQMSEPLFFTTCIMVTKFTMLNNDIDKHDCYC